VRSFSRSSTRSELPPRPSDQAFHSQALGRNAAEPGAGCIKTAPLLSDTGELSCLPTRRQRWSRDLQILSHLSKALLKAQHDTEAEHKHLQESFT